VFYRWDALGRRVGREDAASNTVFFQDGQQTISDYTAGTGPGSPTYNYVYASYVDEPVLRIDSSGAELYYHRNQQYSITALTDATGTISERYAYDAYGKLTVLDGGGTVLGGSAYGNRIAFTGREWDGELGLYHYRARMYSPESGRFVSRDPIGYVDGFSFYRNYFVSSGTDPSGKTVLVTPPNIDLTDFRVHPFGSPPPGCADMSTGMRVEAECTIPGRLWGTRKIRVDCPSRDFDSCCQNSFGAEYLGEARGFAITTGLRRCTNNDGQELALCPAVTTKPTPTLSPVAGAAVLISIILSPRPEVKEHTIEFEEEVDESGRPRQNKPCWSAKKCRGKVIGRYVHAHNCWNAGGHSFDGEAGRPCVPRRMG